MLVFSRGYLLGSSVFSRFSTTQHGISPAGSRPWAKTDAWPGGRVLLKNIEHEKSPSNGGFISLLIIINRWGLIANYMEDYNNR